MVEVYGGISSRVNRSGAWYSCKVRMSYLCKVEMSAYRVVGRGYARGADRNEPETAGCRADVFLGAGDQSLERPRRQRYLEESGSEVATTGSQDLWKGGPEPMLLSEKVVARLDAKGSILLLGGPAKSQLRLRRRIPIAGGAREIHSPARGETPIKVAMMMAIFITILLVPVLHAQNAEPIGNAEAGKKAWDARRRQNGHGEHGGGGFWPDLAGRQITSC